MEKEEDDQHQAVLHVLEGDLALVLEVLAVLLQIGVDLGDKRAACTAFSGEPPCSSQDWSCGSTPVT